MSTARAVVVVVLAVAVSAVAPTPSAAAPADVAADGRVVYVRAHLLAAAHGSVEIQRRYAALVEVPVRDCVGEEYSCTSERRFGQVWRLRFTGTTIRGGDEAPTSETRDVGTVWIATDLNDDEELGFEDALHAALERLNGDAFDTRFAGLQPGKPPTDPQSVVGSSSEPAWVVAKYEDQCDARRSFVERDDEGQIVGHGSYSRSGGESSDRICEALDGVFASASPDDAERMDTDYDVESLALVRVRVVETWRPGSRDSAAFQPIPEHATYTKERRDPANRSTRSSNATTTAGGYSFFRERPGQRVAGEYAPARIEPIRSSSAVWTSRWFVDDVSSTFGTAGGETAIPRFSMLVVALPLANPLDPEIRRFPAPPGEEWTDGVARRLEQEPELTREVLAQAVFSEIPRGADDDWLIVVCGDPDAASYGIVGGLRLLDVTNPRSFCDAALARAAGAS